jgi:predicted GIY-YIG superfamily endonuclease
MIPPCMTAREHEYFVYIMASLSGTLYAGITSTLFNRVMETKQAKSRVLPVNTNAIAWFITSVLGM